MKKSFFGWVFFKGFFLKKKQSVFFLLCITSSTIPTYRKKRMGKKKRDRAAYANKKSIGPVLKHASPTLSNTELARSFHRATEREIKVLWYCEVLQRGEAGVCWCATRAPHVTRLAHTAQVEHHRESASVYTWSYTAYTVLPQIDDV